MSQENKSKILSTRNMTVNEIHNKIIESRETGEPVTFSFGHENKIVRKAIMNGGL